MLLTIVGVVFWQGVKLTQRSRVSQTPESETSTPTPAPTAIASPTREPVPHQYQRPRPPATPTNDRDRPTPAPRPRPRPLHPDPPRCHPDPRARDPDPRARRPRPPRCDPDSRACSPNTGAHALPVQQALAAAEELQRTDDLAGALAAYAEVAARFPEEKQPREAMEMISAGLRSRASKMRPDDLARLRQPLEKAASLDTISSQMLLGEMLRQTDPDDALKWFSAAGNLGQTEAMVIAGQMMASGLGVEAPDLLGAASWFSKAAEKGDSAGMYTLAECHLFGKGVPKDPKRALELLTAASALNDPRAINLLGDLYRKGVPGIMKPNFDESVRLFSQAKELGFLDAQGNLGVLYIYGQGVPKDEMKAVALFRDGAEKGNPLVYVFLRDVLRRRRRD